jgi:transcriptional regulator with XRE-family HTH domain
VTRAIPPDKGQGDKKSRRSSSSKSAQLERHDDGPTQLDGPKAMRADSAPTNVDGPKVRAPADIHDTSDDPLLLGDDGDASPWDEDDDASEDPTIYRGDKPPKPSSSRRLSPTLMRVFQRRREQIGLSIEQLSKLTGIELQELIRFEGTNGNHRLVYDHVVLIAKVLGVRPEDMPGMRVREARDPIAGSISNLTTAVLAGPLLTFEGKSGERFGGDHERVGTTPHFSVKLTDSTLADVWPKGTVLTFVADLQPKAGDIAMLRHRKTKQLAMRRVMPMLLAPICVWQVAFPMPSPDWQPIARLQVVLPRP